MNEKKYKGVFKDAKTGKYYVSTTFTTKDGYQIKKCKRGFDTARKAEAWKNQTALEYAESSYSSITGGKVGIPKLIEDYLKYRKTTLKPLSIKQIKMTLTNYFEPYFKKEASDIVVKDIIEFYNSIGENKTINNKTKNSILSCVKLFVEYLDVVEAISTDIYRKFKKILQPFDITLDKKKELNTFEQEEVNLILKYFEGGTRSQRMYHLLFNILAFTGCRIGEALALKFEDLNLIDNTLHFYKQTQPSVDEECVNTNLKYEMYRGTHIFYFTKANTTKKVLIPEWLVSEIQAYRNSYPSDYIFITQYKKILNRSSVTERLQKACKELDIPTRNIHAFRHYHTSQLYEMGLEPKYIAERLGHTNELTSLKTYKHLSNEQITSNNEKLLEHIS